MYTKIDRTDWLQIFKAIQKIVPNVYSELRQRTAEKSRGCFCKAVKKRDIWTRKDCQYFGCLRAKTGCDLYNKLNDF